MLAGVAELGELVKAQRKGHGLSQEALAQALGFSRTTVALLEQGRRIPSPDLLEKICTAVGIAQSVWQPFAAEEAQARAEFQEVLSEMVGRQMSLVGMGDTDVRAIEMKVNRLFSDDMTPVQTLDRMNELLVAYGAPEMTDEFFRTYFDPDDFQSPDTFRNAVKEFQTDAIRLFSTFGLAYERMARSPDLKSILAPLEPRDLGPFRARNDWDEIEVIHDERLPDLGYISAALLEKEKTERAWLASFLEGLADSVQKDPTAAMHSIPPRKARRADSLLRKFESALVHGVGSPLFGADHDVLRREARAMAPKAEGDIARMLETQQTAMRNLARYLAADHLDVYVATSMRTDADFISVNAFVCSLFQHVDVRGLKLRYFNPTQSWIEDRVAKGLVEALMLRRSRMTIYMAQKQDTFGKDSEASVALGQGKPVIVYVPKLYVPQANVDSDGLMGLGRPALLSELAETDDFDEDEYDETVDTEAMVSKLAKGRLESADDSTLIEAVRAHWADFDLYGETQRFPEGSRKTFREWLDKVTSDRKVRRVPSSIRSDMIGALVAVAMRFERRARIFREVHPLALQVILSSGVLNGILVVRSVDGCAHLVKALLKNELDLKLRVDDDNYRLVESSTQSTIRVISRHKLLTNAFSAFYR